MSHPIENYSRERIGAVWTFEDHAALLHHLDQIERTHTACVRQACPLCHGDGWRYEMRRGLEVPVRCNHEPPSERRDGKMKAAGESTPGPEAA
jgi:hypothetical protein